VLEAEPMNALPNVSLWRMPWPAPLGACAATLGDRVLRLQDEPGAILKALYRFDQLEAGTHNRACHLWQTAPYAPLEFNGADGVARVRHDALTLTLYSRQWALALAVLAPVAGIAPRSLLFFDRHGILLHQLHVPDGTAGMAFEELVCAMLHPDQRQLPLPQAPIGDVEVAHLDLPSLEQSWSVLREPQEFDALLRRYGVRRLRAYRQVRDKFARAVSLDSVPALLALAAARQTPVRMCCGNRGSMQSFEGPVSLPVWQGGSLCIRQPGVRFSLNMREVASVWRVRKPAADSIVTSIELFDGEDQRVLTLSGASGYGRLELPSWRALLADSLLPPEA
jgi:putative hemin transport protein